MSLTITNISQSPDPAPPNTVATMTGTVSLNTQPAPKATVALGLPGATVTSTNNNGNFRFDFIVHPGSTGPIEVYIIPILGLTINPQLVKINVGAGCIHGSSCISLLNGHTKAIRDFANGDTIIDATNQCVAVKHAVQCWLGPKIDDKYQPVLIFEKNSLGPGL